MIRRSALSAGLGILAVTAFAAEEKPRLEELDEVVVSVKSTIRLEDFVDFPKYDNVAVSPDGTRLATGWINGNNYQRAIAVIDYPSMKPARGFTLPGQQNVVETSWASDRQLMFEVSWPVRALRRLKEPVGTLVLTDVEGGNPHVINAESLATSHPLEARRRDDERFGADPRENPDAGSWPGRNAVGPVQVMPVRGPDANGTLIQTLRAHDSRGAGDGYGAFSVDLGNRKQTRLATLPVAGGKFVMGPGQRVALASGINGKNESVVYYLPESVRADGRGWKLVDRSVNGTRGIRPVAWTGNAEEYYALDGRHAPTREIVVWNPASNERRVVHRHASADMDHVSLDPAGKAWMFHGHEYAPVYWYPDANHPLARLHRTLLQRARDELVEIVSASDDLSVAVARVSSGRRPPVYLALDVRTGESAGGLFTYPTLRGTRLSRVEPIEFTARDGLKVRGYLTTPEDGQYKARTGLPLVVIAHDGPVGEQWDASYEYERQLFASRGYAVLQVNRRGSPGRGAAFERAGDGKWGRETQDDYADGVRWAIKDGVADASRVCFYGSGYGAYSAMVAAAREPALFSCVIGVSGVYDMPHFLGDRPGGAPAALTQVLGSDRGELAARSPVSFAADIKARVLLISQKGEEYVPSDQTNRMRSALREAGNAPQVQMIGQEYDGLHTPSTRANGYQAILRFLERSTAR